MENYLSDLKKRLVDYNNLLIQRNNDISKLENMINDYFKKDDFLYANFINNVSIKTAVQKFVADKKLLSSFNEITKELSKMDYVKLSSRLDAKANRRKIKLLEVLRAILKHLEEIKEKYYYTLDERLMLLDDVGRKAVIIEKDFNLMLKRLGLSSEEIVEFNAYVIKQNMMVYLNKTKEIDSALVEKEEKILNDKMAKEERRRKRHVFAKEKSAFAKDLLRNAESFLNELTSYEELDKNMSLAYHDILIEDFDKTRKDINDDELVLKYLLINISNISTYIKQNETKYTESELFDKLNELKNLCDNCKTLLDIRKKELNYTDANEIKTNLNIKLHFIYDDKTNKTYIEQDLQENRDTTNYVKNVEMIIDKIKKGIYSTQSKKNFPKIPNCYYVQQGITYVSFIMLSQDDYIVLTSSKWDDLFHKTNRIYNAEQQQIDSVKKMIQGDAKWKKR